MKLSKIAFSNIKKRKSSAITLAAITAVAVTMLAISLMLLFGIGSFYDTKAEEFNTPHATLALTGYTEDEIEDIFDFVTTYNKVTETETEDCYLSNIKYTINNSTVKTQMIFSKESQERTMNTYTIIDELSKPLNGIILPLSFKFEGFKSGDDFSIQVGSKTFNYKIYGFYESVLFGSAMSNLKMAYITENAFNTISSDNIFMPYTLLYIMFQNLPDSYNFETDFLKEFGSSSSAFAISYDGSKGGVTMFPTIVAMVLILVAAIVVIVALIIARFTIINNIEEDIKTLGALKSIGFTSKQIKWSMVLQFLIIAVTGAILGSILTIALGGFISNIVSSTSGLLWSGSSMLVPIIIAVLSVIAVVVLITYLMSRRSKSVTPINALRSGLSNHSFVKNTAPLEKSKMPLNVNIAAKQFKRNLKNNISAFVMIVMFAFMTVLGLTLYHNFVTDTDAFRQMSGLEMGIIVQFSEKYMEENEDTLNDIKGRDNIRKTFEFNLTPIIAGGTTIDVLVWDDIEKKEADSIVEGRYPQADDEIAIPKYLAGITGKNRGERLSIEFEGTTESYLITGITQTAGNPTLDITKEGFSKLKSSFVFTCLYIYLNDAGQETVDSFMDSLIDDYGKDIYLENASEVMDGILGTIGGPVGIATYFILAIEVFVICFVFFLMINTIIRRRKKEAGIMKAIGFTSGQLISQMLLSVLPVIIGGILVGTLLGVFLTNVLLGMMFGGLVAKATFTIPALLVIISEIVLIAICIFTVYLVSLKYKKIAPHKLIVEG
ncbi:MAG: ABC transporter permease [Firmicutes bacterium]|nr:ABC transporter permease [Bacillota bacterium]